MPVSVASDRLYALANVSGTTNPVPVPRPLLATWLDVGQGQTVRIESVTARGELLLTDPEITEALADLRHVDAVAISIGEGATTIVVLVLSKVGRGRGRGRGE
jgi:hypothetical protein